MTDAKDLPYTIAGREMLAKTDDLQVQILSLGPGECVPWHYHSEVADTFVCLDGPMEVVTKNPDTAHRLDPGETYKVPVRKAHKVQGVDGGACRFVIVQGIGAHDFLPIEGAE
ncbi:MAG: cupin domain-containing protein [Alphaproteobacteria bacterium]